MTIFLAIILVAFLMALILYAREVWRFRGLETRIDQIRSLDGQIGYRLQSEANLGSNIRGRSRGWILMKWTNLKKQILFRRISFPYPALSVRAASQNEITLLNLNFEKTKISTGLKKRQFADIKRITDESIATVTGIIKEAELLLPLQKNQLATLLKKQSRKNQK